MVSASIGIAGVPWHATTSDEVLRKADSAMYHREERQDRLRRLQRRSAIGASRAASASPRRCGRRSTTRQFELDYQPIVHIQTRTVLAIESLVRWNHPELGRLLPDDFIRVAEHTGLINPLTVVRGRARADASGRDRARPDDCGIAVNVSPHSLHQAAFPGRIRELLDAHGMTRVVADARDHREPVDVGSRSARCACLDELHDMGVRLVIDDFGKGYSSLSYLRRLPVDEIKIDRSFIIGLADGEDDTLVRMHDRAGAQPRDDGGRGRRRVRGGAPAARAS